MKRLGATITRSRVTPSFNHKNSIKLHMDKHSRSTSLHCQKFKPQVFMNLFGFVRAFVNKYSFQEKKGAHSVMWGEGTRQERFLQKNKTTNVSLQTYTRLTRKLEVVLTVGSCRKSRRFPQSATFERFLSRQFLCG